MSTIRTRMAALVPDLAEGRWAPEDDPTYGAVAGAHQDLRKELWQHLKAAGEVLKQLDNIKGGNNPPSRISNSSRSCASSWPPTRPTSDASSERLRYLRREHVFGNAGAMVG